MSGSSSANNGSRSMRPCMKSPPTRITYKMCSPAAARMSAMTPVRERTRIRPARASPAEEVTAESAGRAETRQSSAAAMPTSTARAKNSVYGSVRSRTYPQPSPHMESLADFATAVCGVSSP